MNGRRFSSVLGLLCVAYLSACSAVRIKVIDPTDVLREFRQDILSSSSFSPTTTQAFRMAGVSQEDVLEHGVDPAVLDRFEALTDKVDRVYVESEVLIGRAQRVESRDPRLSVALYLMAAKLSLGGIFLPECQYSVELKCDSFKVFYERAVRGVLTYVEKDKSGTENFGRFSLPNGRGFDLVLSRNSGLEDLRRYTSVVPASSIGLEGLTNRQRRSGLGVALSACRPREEGVGHEAFLPRVGVCVPLTAVLTFPSADGGNTGANASLEIHNSLSESSICVDGRDVPLSADFTAPMAELVEKTGMGAFDGLFDAISGNEALLKQTGFYTLEPYSSGKIPLITVHGLFSSPLTWIDLHNDLLGDAMIREHFQVWHYLYPTNLPIPENAKTFREKLDQLQEYLVSQSPNGTSPDMVIVAHSMGGLLTRTAVAPDSEPLKSYLFETPSAIDQLDRQTRETLEQYINFTQKKYVARVIFVAVPHRGSSLADNWIGIIGRALLSVPRTIVQKSATVVKGMRNVVRPDLRTAFDGGQPSSIWGLSAKNPSLQAISQLKIAPEIPYHSVIGNRGKPDADPQSDGVVPYTSSHLDGAQSELIVPADHSAHTHPLAVQEIRRILRLHLSEEEAKECGAQAEKAPCCERCCSQ